MKIFLIADTHFFHGNIIKYCDRPFEDYNHMNQELIKKWNDKVSNNDLVFHLGDFAFRNKAKEIRPKLNGTIILIRGNHDLNLCNEDGFIISEEPIKIHYNNKKYILSHKPLPEIMIPEGYINIFGHIHNYPAYTGICVSVEQIEYEPIEFEKISLNDLYS